MGSLPAKVVLRQSLKRGQFGTRGDRRPNNLAVAVSVTRPRVQSLPSRRDSSISRICCATSLQWRPVLLTGSLLACHQVLDDRLRQRQVVVHLDHRLGRVATAAMIPITYSSGSSSSEMIRTGNSPKSTVDQSMPSWNSSCSCTGSVVMAAIIRKRGCWPRQSRIGQRETVQRDPAVQQGRGLPRNLLRLQVDLFRSFRISARPWSARPVRADGASAPAPRGISRGGHRPGLRLAST